MNEEPGFIDRLTTYEVNINFPPAEVANLMIGVVLAVAISSFFWFKIKKKFA